MIRFDEFEAWAESLVEGTFGRLFRPPLHPSELVRRLVRAVEDAQCIGDDGQLVFPNRYWIFLSRADYFALGDDEDALRTGFLHCLQRLAEERGGRFGGRLVVTLQRTADVSAGQVEVRAAHISDPGSGEATREAEVVALSTDSAERWLLRQGNLAFPLGGPVIRFGRALSNDIILDDPRVSRRHAQVRWREGKYYLSDVDGGHAVHLNGEPIGEGEEAPLAAGDVISLAGVVLTVEWAAEKPSQDPSGALVRPSAGQTELETTP